MKNKYIIINNNHGETYYNRTIYQLSDYINGCYKHGYGPLDVWYDCQKCIYENNSQNMKIYNTQWFVSRFGYLGKKL